MPSLFQKLFSKSYNDKSVEFKQQLSSLLGFTPADISNYQIALTHRSIAKIEQSNERLEFLGDAVLNLTVSDYLYNNYKDVPEGELSKLRSKLVNRDLLNEIALKMQLNVLLKSSIGALDNPKFIYGNALEALIGAVYIDKGEEKCKEFILTRVLDMESRKDSLREVDSDFKSRLMEWSQKKGKAVRFETKVMDDNVPNYRASLLLNGVHQCDGFGESKKEAEQQASKLFFEQKK